MAKDEMKDTLLPEEESVETLEYTDDDGVEHCFVIESKFKVGEDQYAALIEVDPALFEEGKEDHHHGDGCGCGHHHEHGEECGHEHHHHHGEGCGCGHHHEHGEECGHHRHEHEQEEEETNIILAKITEDENGEIDIQVPTDEEFEKAVAAYEALTEEE